MPELMIILSQDDFRKIVAGRAIDVEVKLRGVQWWIRIGLKEIDIEKMTQAFRDAVEGLAGVASTGEQERSKAPEGENQTGSTASARDTGGEQGPPDGGGSVGHGGEGDGGGGGKMDRREAQDGADRGVGSTDSNRMDS
jgi:hypothetical protein